jgi:hypothetical protein
MVLVEEPWREGALTRLIVPAICVLLASPALAQQSDDSTSPSIVERARTYVDKFGGDGDDDDEPEGFYPQIGGLTTGSGLALGAGYRNHFFGDAFYGDLSGRVSTKKYFRVDARLRLPSPVERLQFWTGAIYRHLPQEEYFGLGAASRRDDRSNYGIDSLDVTGEALYRLTPALHVGARLGYFMPEVEPGTDDNYPSIEQRFTDATAPGLAAQPDFLHYGIFTEFDSRDARGNPRRGGFYTASLEQWNDQSLNGYDFRRFDLELRHYVPIGSPRHVLVGRGGVSYVNNDEGERVPFYVFPYVGGADTIRSFEEFRFRDENAMFISGEYRLGVHEYVQLLAFVDAGKVTADWNDINFSRLEKGYGGGVRAGTASRTFVRLEFATGGGEGTRVYLKFMPSF